MSALYAISTQTPEDRKRALEAAFEKCAQLAANPVEIAAPSAIFDCYLSNAKDGYPLAQLKLGFMYHAGSGVERNLMLSYVWHTLAWSRDRKIGRKYVENISAKLEGWEIAEAKRITRRCRASSFKDCDFVDPTQ